MPSIPDNIRIYAIGDIHGRADLLEQVYRRIDDDMLAQPVASVLQVHLGDYVDRGADSRSVIDKLIARGRQHDAVFLRGNHEAIMQQFLSSPAMLNGWRRTGGTETLISYGLAPLLRSSNVDAGQVAATLDEALPESHKRFLDDLQTTFQCGDFFFVHAGVRPGIELAAQRDDDLLYIRDDFLLHTGSFGKVIVHGHTPVKAPDVRANRINIDTGAYATGRLTCLVIEKSQIRFL